MNSNPQAQMMESAVMVRTLAAQAEAIWPLELPLFDAYTLPNHPTILDIGCGTGEITQRLAHRFPGATLIGVDLCEAHLESARSRCKNDSHRVSFEVGDAFHLPIKSRTVDLAVCRHLVQAVPEPERVVVEAYRTLRSGGWFHLLAEDYGMLEFHPSALDIGDLWKEAPRRFGEATQTDLYIGRRAPALLEKAGFVDIRSHILSADTHSVERTVFSRILASWAEGYAQVMSEVTDFTFDEVMAYFDEMQNVLENPAGYASWKIPIAAGRVP